MHKRTINPCNSLGKIDTPIREKKKERQAHKKIAYIKSQRSTKCNRQLNAPTSY